MHQKSFKSCLLQAFEYNWYPYWLHCISVLWLVITFENTWEVHYQRKPFFVKFKATYLKRNLKGNVLVLPVKSGFQISLDWIHWSQFYNGWTLTLLDSGFSKCCNFQGVGGRVHIDPPPRYLSSGDLKISELKFSKQIWP